MIFATIFIQFYNSWFFNDRPWLQRADSLERSEKRKGKEILITGIAKVFISERRKIGETGSRKERKKLLRKGKTFAMNGNHGNNCFHILSGAASRVGLALVSWVFL